MSELPAPLIVPEADVSDFAFTPVYRHRLFGSAFHAKATDSEWRAGVTLWLKSQDQFPSGSLPDDDTELCRLAELGRDMKTWRRVREGALRGWFKCDDGRLYHRVIAEIVGSQWTAKLKQEERKKEWRDKKRKQRGHDENIPEDNQECPSGQTNMSCETSPHVPRENALKGQGDGQGQGQGLSKKEPNGSSGVAPSARQPAKPLALDWIPDEDDRAYAAALGLNEADIEREAVKFRGYWTKGTGRGKARSPKGWHQGWQNWVGKALERLPARAVGDAPAALGTEAFYAQRPELKPSW